MPLATCSGGGTLEFRSEKYAWYVLGRYSSREYDYDLVDVSIEVCLYSGSMKGHIYALRTIKSAYSLVIDTRGTPNSAEAEAVLYSCASIPRIGKFELSTSAMECLKTRKGAKAFASVLAYSRAFDYLTLPSGPPREAEPSVAEQLLQAVGSCTELRHVRVFDIGSSKSNYTTVSNMLSVVDTVGLVHVSGQRAGAIAASLVQRRESLERIIVDHGQGPRDPESDVCFWQAVAKSPALRSIQCDPPLARSDSLESQDALEAALRQHSGLRELLLMQHDNHKYWQTSRSERAPRKGEDVRTRCFYAIAAGATTNKSCSVRKIRVDADFVPADDAAHLRQLLCSRLRCPKVLDLRGFQCGRSGLVPLFEGLQAPGCRLETLRLCGLEISEQEAAALRDSLRTNERLTKLVLFECVFEGKAFGIFSDGLDMNVGLEQLVCIKTEIVADREPRDRRYLDRLALSSLFHALKTNGTLRRLVLPEAIQLARSHLLHQASTSLQTVLRWNVGLEQIEGDYFERESDAMERLLDRKAPRSISIARADYDPVYEGQDGDIFDPVDRSVHEWTKELLDAVPPGLMLYIYDDARSETISFRLPNAAAGASSWPTEHTPGWPVTVVCLLRLLAEDEDKRPDAAEVCKYAAAALRPAWCDKEPGGCLLVASAVVDGMRERKLDEDPKVEEYPDECAVVNFLPPSATAGSGLWQAAEEIAKGRTYITRSGPEGKWAGTVHRCTQVLYMEGRRRGSMLLQFRRAVEVKRDAAMVFKAAREGRLMELAKRLRLGRLAGKQATWGVLIDGYFKVVSALEAARRQEHEECFRLLSHVEWGYDSTECTDNVDIMRSWLTERPVALPDRAAGLLCLVANDGDKRPDAAQVYAYAAAALRQAWCDREPGDCLLVASTVVDGMRERTLYFTRMDHLRPSAIDMAGSGLWQAAEEIVKGRTYITGSEPEDEWADTVVQCNAVLRLEGRRRGRALLQFRRAVEVKRDAAMVFRAARDGRPMELAKRLRLGRLAGERATRGRLDEDERNSVTALEAATIGGHEECQKLLEEVEWGGAERG